MWPALPWGRFSSAVAVVAVSLFIGAGSAGAAPLPDPPEPMFAIAENGQPGLLSLTSSVAPLEIPWLEPGGSFSWQVGLNLADQREGDGFLDFIPYGGLTQAGSGFQLTAQRCQTQWTGHSGTGSALSCPSGATTPISEATLEDGPTARVPVGEVIAGTNPHIRFTLTRTSGSGSADSFTFALGITAMGKEAAAPGALPNTGTALAGILGASVSLLGAGLLITRLGRTRAGA